MKLYIESQMWGMYEVGAKVEELTPEFIDAYIEYAKGFEKIGYPEYKQIDLQYKGQIVGRK